MSNLTDVQIPLCEYHLTAGKGRDCLWCEGLIGEQGSQSSRTIEDAIALISAKRDEWKAKAAKLFEQERWTAHEHCKSMEEAACRLLALLTGENKDSECEAKGDSTTTDS